MAARQNSRAKKSHRSAIVVIPPEALWPPIQQIRAQYDRQFRRWMPHITLVYPFLPPEALEPAIPRIAAAVRDLPVFSLTLAQIRHFRHSRRSFTLWLEPAPAQPLLALQQRLGLAFPEFTDQANYPTGFTPHLSLGQAGSPRELNIRKQRLQQHWKPLTFLVNEIYLIERGNPPEDVFRIRERFPLQPTGGAFT